MRHCKRCEPVKAWIKSQRVVDLHLENRAGSKKSSYFDMKWIGQDKRVQTFSILNSDSRQPWLLISSNVAVQVRTRIVHIWDLTLVSHVILSSNVKQSSQTSFINCRGNRQTRSLWSHLFSRLQLTSRRKWWFGKHEGCPRSFWILLWILFQSSVHVFIRPKPAKRFVREKHFVDKASQKKSHKIDHEPRES